MKKICMLGLSLLMVVSMAACGKTEEPEITPEHNYAENDVVDKPTEKPTTTSGNEVEVIVMDDTEEEEYKPKI